MSRVIRKLAKALYERTKNDSWEIRGTEVQSPCVKIDETFYQLEIKDRGSYLCVSVYITDKAPGKYPLSFYFGIRQEVPYWYYVSFPLRWEMRLFRRLIYFHDRMVPTQVDHYLELEEAKERANIEAEKAEERAEKVKRQDLLAKLKTSPVPPGSLSLASNDSAGHLSLSRESE